MNKLSRPTRMLTAITFVVLLAGCSEPEEPPRPPEVAPTVSTTTLGDWTGQTNGTMTVITSPFLPALIGGMAPTAGKLALTPAGCLGFQTDLGTRTLVLAEEALLMPTGEISLGAEVFEVGNPVLLTSSGLPTSELPEPCGSSADARKAISLEHDG